MSGLIEVKHNPKPGLTALSKGLWTASPEKALWAVSGGNSY